MTKHALVGLGLSLRSELAPDGIGVTVVCPGPVDTGLLDEGSATPGMSVRRYLTTAAGRAISAGDLSRAVVVGVWKNKPLVTPGRAGLLWRLQRISPGVVEKQIAKTMAAELRIAESTGRAATSSEAD